MNQRARAPKYQSRLHLLRQAIRLLPALLCLCLSLPMIVRAQTNPPTLEPIIESLQTHDYSQALALSGAFTRTQPSDVRGWTLQGMALEGLGRGGEGLEAFERALKIDPDYVPALEAAAQQEYRAGSPKALPLLKRLLRLNPRDETVHAMLGALAFKRNDCDAAVGHFEKSSHTINNSLPALREFGDCLFRAHRPVDAIPVFRRMLELHPDDGEFRYDLGLVQFSAHQYQDALHTLLPLAEGPSPDAAALNLIAAAYEANGETPQAVAAYRRAITLAPRDVDNYLDLATLSLDHGSYEVGVDVLNAGLRARPGSAPLYLERGALLVQMGRYREADADFRKAEALRPTQNYSSVALGISLLQENRLGSALQVVKQRLSVAPNDPILNYVLAEILIRQGIKVGTPQFQEALTAAQRAARYKADFALDQDVLSELYLRSGETSRATEAARLALKADPDSQAAIYHLIVCLRKEGGSKELQQLVKRLAGVTASLQKQRAIRDHFRLVEGKSSSP